MLGWSEQSPECLGCVEGDPMAKVEVGQVGLMAIKVVVAGHG